jgi:hypothetical protein
MKGPPFAKKFMCIRIGNQVFSHFLHFLKTGLSYRARDEFIQLGRSASTDVMSSAVSFQGVYGGNRR